MYSTTNTNQQSFIPSIVEGMKQYNEHIKFFIQPTINGAANVLNSEIAGPELCKEYGFDKGDGIYLDIDPIRVMLSLANKIMGSCFQIDMPESDQLLIEQLLVQHEIDEYNKRIELGDKTGDPEITKLGHSYAVSMEDVSDLGPDGMEFFRHVLCYFDRERALRFGQEYCPFLDKL
jgi:hypothetical protein